MSDEVVTPTDEKHLFTLSLDDLFQPDTPAFAPEFLDEMTYHAYEVVADKLKEAAVDENIKNCLDNIVIMYSLMVDAAAGKTTVTSNCTLIDNVRELSKNLVKLAGPDAWQPV